MARQMDIAPRTMSHIIKQDLGVGAFKHQTGQCLTIVLKENREKNQDTCSRTVKSITKKSSLQMKKIYCGGNYQ